MKKLKLEDLFNKDLNGIYEHDFVLIVVNNKLYTCEKSEIKNLERYIQYWAPSPYMISVKK